jgi:hypothetical protein
MKIERAKKYLPVENCRFFEGSCLALNFSKTWKMPAVVYTCFK